MPGAQWGDLETKQLKHFQGVRGVLNCCVWVTGSRPLENKGS